MDVHPLPLATPPATLPTPPSVPAAPVEGAARDRRATERDRAAERRDVRATTRDRQARKELDDGDGGFAARFLSACDRDSAAGDRAAAQADRAAARRDRAATEPPEDEVGPASAVHDALDERAAFHRAQGVLMSSRGLTSAQASEALLATAQEERSPLSELIARVVRDGRLLSEAPPGP